MSGRGSMAGQAAVAEGRECGPLAQYLREIRRIPVLSAAEERRIATRAARGERDAIDALVRHNLRFAVLVARRYVQCGVPLEDLVNEGNVGLIRAAERFDPERGYRFISYAVWWIRHAILQCLSYKSRIVRLPVNRIQQLVSLVRTSDRLAVTLGREPTTDEVSGIAQMPLEKIEWLRSLPTTRLSIDGSCEGEDADFQADTLQDARAGALEANVAEQLRNERLARCLWQLDARGADIVRRYYGLGDGAPESLESIGRRYGVTRERVRQLRDRALAELRSSPDCLALADS